MSPWVDGSATCTTAQWVEANRPRPAGADAIFGSLCSGPAHYTAVVSQVGDCLIAQEQAGSGAWAVTHVEHLPPRARVSAPK